jgi:hypothetical protein
VLAAGFLIVSTAARSDQTALAPQWAIAYLTEPTLIGSTVVEGPVLFVHDERRMARGEPCTSVRLFEPGIGPAEEIATFRCIPTPRRKAAKFTVTTRPNNALGYGCVLTEFQFAGDREGHAVPMVLEANWSEREPEDAGRAVAQLQSSRLR